MEIKSSNLLNNKFNSCPNESTVKMSPFRNANLSCNCEGMKWVKSTTNVGVLHHISQLFRQKHLTRSIDTAAMKVYLGDHRFRVTVITHRYLGIDILH